jgi:L-threonylcarbamoyladenylate synthase
MKIVPATTENIAAAARAIRQGGLVGIPTETVYGIAADATNAEAVRNVYEAKGRPDDNPLIVHIAHLDQLDQVAAHVPPEALRLAERFWPGPLTLVLPKKPELPDEVTGGLDTVAVRVPDHLVALALIRQAERPLAAPSANRFMRLSPTRAEDISGELAAAMDMILDGGQCRIGVESTVVDASSEALRILRPGGVSRADVQAALGAPLAEVAGPMKRLSPGMYQRHYAPAAQLVLVEELGPSDIGLTFGEPRNERQFRMPRNPAAYASVLYTYLNRLDKENPKAICVETPPDTPEWETVLDRLRKASA